MGRIGLLILIAIALLVTAGCTSEAAQQTEISDYSNTESGTQGDVSSETQNSESSQAATTVAAEYSKSLLYPDAFGRGERVYFNDETSKIYSAGDSKATMSIYPENNKASNGFYIKNMKDAEKCWVKPPSGKKYYLMDIAVFPMGEYSQSYLTPYTSNFTLLDGSADYSPILEFCDDPEIIIENKNSHDYWINENYVIEGTGSIYVCQNIYKTLNSGSVSNSGWLVFEVPDSFEPSKDTYLKLNLGDNEVYWKVLDLIASVDVTKNPTKGDIQVRFDGGSEAQLIGSINVDVIMPDGTINSDSLIPDENEYQIPIGSELVVSGSPPGEGSDHVIVYFIRRDGEMIIKFDDYLKAAARI